MVVTGITGCGYPPTAMSPRRSIALVAAIGCALAAAATILLRSNAGPSIPGHADPSPEPEVSPPLDPAGPGTTSGDPVGALTWEAQPLAALVPPPAFGGFVLDVVDAGRADSEARARVVAGPALAEPGAHGLHLVEVRSGLAGVEGGIFHRYVRLAPGSAGPSSEGSSAGTASGDDAWVLVGSIELGPRRTARGRVIDADGQPVAGAAVWAGTSDRVGTPQVVHTDADGAFAVEAVPQGAGLPLVVVSPGRPSCLRRVVFDERETTWNVRLAEPAPPLDVRSLARVRRQEDGVVWCVPGGEGVSTSARGYPFLVAALPAVHAALFPDGAGAGLLHLDATGASRIDDLPRGLELEAWLDHPDVVSSEASTVRPDRPNTLVIRGRAQERRLRGRVLDVSRRAAPRCARRARGGQSQGTCLRARGAGPPGPGRDRCSDVFRRRLRCSLHGG